MKQILVLVLSILSLSTFAQKDAKAKEVLDQASLAFNKAGAMSISFTLHIKELAQDVSESFEGTMDMKGAKFHINTPDMETWFDGKTQWVLQKEWEEVSISEPDEKEVQALNPSTIFELYKEGSGYKYLGEKSDSKGRRIYEVELTPKSGDITRLRVQFSAKDYLPLRIFLSYRNEVENTIHINQYASNTNLSDAAFVFDKKKYPDAEIIDLR